MYAHARAHTHTYTHTHTHTHTHTNTHARARSRGANAAKRTENETVFVSCHTSIFVGARPVCNLRFVDDIDLMSGSNVELEDLTNKLADRTKAR